MNSLELHILATLSETPDTQATDFHDCGSTLSILTEAEMIGRAEVGDHVRYWITDKGRRGLADSRAEGVGMPG